LNVRLLHRGNRKVVLTDAGQSYVASCRRIIEEIAEVERTASCEYRAPQGELTISLPENGVAERLIGSIQRECLDHVVIWGEAHLRRILKSYVDYYNGVRTHRSLNKDAPVSRPVQRIGVIRSRSILGGLHHQYARV
jgi:hypothetical protein